MKDHGMDIGLIFGPPAKGMEEDEDSPMVDMAKAIVGKDKGQDLYDLICEVIEAKRGKAETKAEERAPEDEEY